MAFLLAFLVDGGVKVTSLSGDGVRSRMSSSLDWYSGSSTSSLSRSSSRRFSSSDSVFGSSASSLLVILGKTSMLSSVSEIVNLSEPLSVLSGVAGGSSCRLSSLTLTLTLTSTLRSH